MKTKKDIESILHLSPLQEGLLFHAIADKAADPYFTQTGFVLEGKLDPEAFARAWQTVVDRHAILRTCFAWEGIAKPVQVVRKAVAISLQSHDWRGRSERAREEDFAAFLAEDRRAGFDFLKPPLMRLALLRIADDAWYFVNSHHHILLDGWSFALVLREALVAYHALVAKTPLDLPPARPYREYLGWVKARNEADAEAFWRGAMAGFHTPTTLPADALPGRALEDDAFPHAERELRFSSAQTEALVACARSHRITLNTLVQGAWSCLLHRHGGEPEVVFGSTVSGRPPDLAGSDSIVGLLINTLPIRVSVADDEPLGPWLQRLQDRNSELRQHEWTPLSQLQRWSEVPGGQALFESIVVFDSYPEEDVAEMPTELRVRALPRPSRPAGDAILTAGRNNYPLSLIVEPTSELRLILCYERRRFTHEGASRLLTQCATLLEAMAARPQARLGELPLMSERERQRILVDWNATEALAPATMSVHELFEAEAQRRPDTLAVVCEYARLSYRELDARANRLAHRLRALGVGTEDRVALCVERSVEMIIGLLGVLKAGAAYVPLDPKFPRERRRDIALDSGARVVIAKADADFGEGVTLLDPAEASLAAEPSSRLSIERRPGQLAYLIYTSGSTGRPKGVAVEHRQLVNYVRGVLGRLPLAESTSMALVSTVAADLGHTSLFGALCSGRTLHVLADERIFDPDRMAEYMRHHAVDGLKIVPSHLTGLLEAKDPERVLPRRCLVIGGEAASAELVEKIHALAPDCRIVNHYGPTETTVGTLTWEVPQDGNRTTASLPIGRPLPNTQAYILDQNLQPVPVGVPGELYIGGAGVARGYHDRSRLTAERFLPDPFGTTPGGRLYRTGDRARYRSDGAIEFLGRTDHQIKLRGYRIELGEIESALREEPNVREAVVVVHDDAGSKRLVAYVAGADIEPTTLLGSLGRRLPDYMLPSVLVPLASLPLTPNGKIDRAALPALGQTAAADPDAFVAPRNEVETILAHVWADVLGKERVSIHDNFFGLGGDSIRSLQVIARANQRGIKLTPKQLFEHPTVAKASEVAVVKKAAAPALPAPPAPEPPKANLSGLTPEELDRLLPDPASIEDVYPLSPMQQGMLFHTLLNPSSGVYLMQQQYTWSGPLDVPLLIEAWQSVIDRHPMMRTSFAWQDLERPLQIVRRVNAADVILVQDLREMPEAERQASIDETLEAELRAGLDMTRAPLMRIRLFRLADETYRIVRSFHHILTDDWCFSVLMMECLNFYGALRSKQSISLPMPRPYRDYIAWLDGRDLAAGEQFWRQELRGFSAPTRLGVERILKEDVEPADTMGDAFIELSPSASQEIAAFAQRHQLTVNTLVQGAWALLLSRYSGNRDVLFGVTVAGRPTELPGVESIVGLFINTLPLRVQVSPERGIVPWLQELLTHNYRIRQFEYPPLVQMQQWSELPNGQSLFNSLVVFENAPLDPRLGEQVGDVQLSFEHDRVHTNYPMTVVAYPGARLGVRLSYDERCFDDAAVRRMLDHLGRALEDMVRHEGGRLGDIALLGDAEQQRLLVDWNSTAGEAPPAASYVSIFEAQVRKTPDADAVSCRGRRLTYSGLNRAADRVAGALRAEGVGPDGIVAVLEERDIDLVVAAVGVLKVGGVYLPLDPSHPSSRLAQVIATSRARVVLTSEAWAPALSDALARLPEGERPRLVLREKLAAHATDATNAAGPGHLAYVIYTSGSTGTPKGAMVEHAGMLNNVWGKVPSLSLTPRDVVGQTASQCFDISVWQLLSALLCGARVHIVPGDVVADPQRLLEEAEAEGITILELVPSLLREIVQAQASTKVLTRLRWMLPTGEALTPDLCRKWFERFPHVPLMNAYGPAECADDVALHVLTAALPSDATHVPIGRSVPHVQLHVLVGDALAPIGAIGELCVGGIGVGRGYIHDPRRTAEVFVPDPFRQEPGARMYRTGDLARRLEDGTLEFIGRRDHQVKVRGFRIELGEIEVRLAEHPGVHATAVLVRAEQLVAYVATGALSQGEPPTGAQLREFLRETLPDYMVPVRFVFLPELPLTPNGKVDRQALPSPDVAAEGATAAIELPRTPTEDVLAGIWGEVLGRERVGIDESFFELGGHSLLATRVVSRVRHAFGVELPLRSLFDHPTVAELARDIDARRTADLVKAPPLVSVPRDNPLPLSFAQQRLWFLAQLEPDSAEYNMTAAVRVTGDLDLALFERSLAALLARHEALRTSFAPNNGEPVQVIAEGAKVPFEAFDLSDTPASEQEARVQRIAAEHAGRPFDLGRAPVIRVAAAKLGAGEHVLVLVVHHIVADGWSMSVLVGELAELYDAERSARPSTLRSLPIQYADFAVWQREWMRGPVREAHLGYWRQRLQDPPPALDLRPDHVPVGAPTYRGARFEMDIEPELAEALRNLGRQHGATLFMTLLAAFEVLLFQRTGQTDLLIGTDVAGRSGVETEGLIGFFVNLLVLRTDLGGAPTFRELLGRVRATTLDAYAHQDLPFEQVVDAVRAPRIPGRHPLVQTLFVMQNTPSSDLELPGLRFRAMDLEWDAARFDLALFVEETSEGTVGVWKYRADLFEATTIEAMATSLLGILRRVAAEPESRITALVATEPKERAKRSRALPAGGLKSFKRATDAFITTRLAKPTETMPLVVEPARRDVDLAAWAQAERTFVEEKLLHHGALLFRGFGLTSVGDFENVARSVCGELFGEYGDLPREKAGKDVYGSTPYPADKAILFHNESSHLPRWPLKQWFFCTQASPEGGATPIVDCRRLHEALSPELRARFQRLGLLYVRNFTPGYDVSWQDFFHTSEPMVVEERCRVSGMRCDWMDGGRLRISQRGPAVLQHPKTRESVFFNQIQLHHPAYLEAPVRESLLAMLGERWLPRHVTYGDGSPIEEETTRVLGELYERYAVRNPWQSGDLLMLDNMLVAHGRDPFKGPRKIVVAMGQMVSHADVEVTP
ncbi:amino acid adenylation domain-containing protein [Pendulispora rubella]|uniref:Amino acid adenylation domain-containing protein n=1 Tax=Pendulispora rubella TaxID=2741070 RepID=A0ABZ2LC22_9BACT